MERNLNQEQKKAVCHEKGPMLVLAGPGSGKTTVLLARVLRLLRQGLAKPDEILVLTFSKAAAEELKGRFAKLSNISGISFGTFHSIFFRILRSAYGWKVEQVFREEERRNVMRHIVEKMEWDIPDIEEYLSQFFGQMGLMRSELLELRDFHAEGIPAEEFRKLYHAYENYKEWHGKIDFDDMLVRCYQLLAEDAAVRAHWQRKYRFLLVDEFQDVNHAQFACLQILSEPHQNLFVVGDDDQSIYAFRGARPDILLDFPKFYPDAEQVILRTNYRSTERIISIAERLITKNEVRFAKHMHGQGEKGVRAALLVTEDATEEAARICKKIVALRDEGVPLTEMAVIYRTNLQSGAFAREFCQRGIPYELREKGSNIYEHWIAKDLLAYLLLAENEESNTALRRILNKPKRYISKLLLEEAEQMPYNLLRSLFVCPSLQKWQEESLENLRMDLVQIRKRAPYEALCYVRKVIGYDEYLEQFAAYRRTSAQLFWEIADEITEMAKGTADAQQFRERLEEMSRQMQEQTKRSGAQRGVQLLTMHGAKGLEFRHVFLPSLVEGVVPHTKGLDAIEEERRLFYVAITRAEEKLYFSVVRKRYEEQTKPSRFLEEIGWNPQAFLQKSLPKSKN